MILVLCHLCHIHLKTLLKTINLYTDNTQLMTIFDEENKNVIFFVLIKNFPKVNYEKRSSTTFRSVKIYHKYTYNTDNQSEYYKSFRILGFTYMGLQYKYRIDARKLRKNEQNLLRRTPSLK